MQAQPDTEGAGAWLQIAHAMQERTSREHHHPSRHTVIRGDGSRLPAVEPPPPPAGCEVLQVGGLPNPSELVATARRARHQARLSTRASVGTNLEAVAAVAAAIPLAADDGVHACCLSDPEARCPTLVNKTNWWGPRRPRRRPCPACMCSPRRHPFPHRWDPVGHASGFGDAFHVTQEGTRLHVTRVDDDADAAGGGWGMELSVLCCAPADSEAAARLTAARAQKERAAAAAAEEAAVAALDELRGHYWVLGVRVDFTAAELKKAFRTRSIQYHPDRAGGSTSRMARLASSYECLSVAACKTHFDFGRDLEGYNYEQVERHYFPERYPFEPFGDPFAHDRDQSRRQRSDLRRKERMWTPGAAGPSLAGQEATTDEEPPEVPSEATTDEDGWSSGSSGGSSGGEEPQDDPKDEL